MGKIRKIGITGHFYKNIRKISSKIIKFLEFRFPEFDIILFIPSIYQERFRSTMSGRPEINETMYLLGVNCKNNTREVKEVF